MKKKMAVVFFWIGVVLVCLAGLLFVSLLLNLFGFDFESFMWTNTVLSGPVKFLIAILLLTVGLVIAKITGKSAGKTAEGTSFKERMKKSLKG